MESRLSEYLLDSDVLIQHLRGHGATTDLLTRSALNGPLGIAAICRTEVIAGMRDKERAATMRFLDALACYPLDASVADRAGELIRHSRCRGIMIDVPDAIIAATALEHGLVLLTYNARHFPIPELKLFQDMPLLG